jgi:hypothetical protein
MWKLTGKSEGSWFDFQQGKKIFLFLTSVYFISETQQDSGLVIPAAANVFMTKAWT